MLVSQNNFSMQRINNKPNNKNFSNNISSSMPNRYSNNSLNNTSSKNVSFKGVGSFFKNIVWGKVLKFYMETYPKNRGEEFFSCGPVSKAFKGLANFKPLKGVYGFLEVEKNNLLFKQPVLDLVGCALYVNAALNNKQVPAEKRPFLAAYDAVNGLTTVILSVGIGALAASERVTNGINDKLFGALKKNHPVVSRAMPGLIGGTLGVVASMIFAKRIIAPLISTPAAASLKGVFGGKKIGKTPEQKPTALTVSTAQKATVLNTSELFKRLQQRKV